MSKDLKSVILFIAGFSIFYVTLLGAGIFLAGMLRPINNNLMFIGIAYSTMILLLLAIPSVVVLLSALSSRAGR